jgi:hypothetical protein
VAKLRKLREQVDKGTLMLAQGTPLHVVSEILGHASITITKDVYGHLLEGDKRAAATSMSRLCSGPEPVAPSVAPTAKDKGPFHDRNGPLSWAQPEGFQPPTF